MHHNWWPWNDIALASWMATWHLKFIDINILEVKTNPVCNKIVYMHTHIHYMFMSKNNAMDFVSFPVQVKTDMRATNVIIHKSQYKTFFVCFY